VKRISYTRLENNRNNFQNNPTELSNELSNEKIVK